MIVDPSRKRQVSEEKDYNILSKSEMSWTQTVFGKVTLSQWSLDDEYTPMSGDEEATQCGRSHWRRHSKSGGGKFHHSRRRYFHL